MNYLESVQNWMFKWQIQSTYSTIKNKNKLLKPTETFQKQFSLNTKGQIISNGLFDVFELSKKTNEQIRRTSSKNEFICLFFGRIQGNQKSRPL